MSTKNLGRTAIEGGRTTHYKDRVEEFEGSFRASNRDYTRKVSNDVEAFDDELDPKRRKKSKKNNQTDHLRPVYNLLDSMVGRPWSKVFSEICEKFDSRTLAGRHVLYDHIINEIDPHAHVPMLHQWYRRNDYYIDDHGVFSKRKHARRKYEYNYVSQKYAEKIRDWLNGRAIIRQGSKLYWGYPLLYGKAVEGVTLLLDIYQGKVSGMRYGFFSDRFRMHYPFTDWGSSLSWRQNQGLTREETKFFDSTPKWVHNVLLVHGAEDKAA